MQSREQIEAGAEIHSGGGYQISTHEKQQAFAARREQSLAAARINDLMRQCGYAAPEIAGRAQKLVRLIVEECAAVAARTECPYSDEMIRAQFGHTWDMACVDAAKNVRQHFGVK